MPVLPQSVVVKPVPDGKGAHECKDSARGAHANRVWLEDGAQHVSLIRTHSQQDKVLLPTLHLLLHCETNHEDAEDIPKEVQEAVVQEHGRKEAPNLTMLDIVGELGLEGVQCADPPLLVT